MTRTRTPVVQVVFLLVAALGLVIQILGGVPGFPPVPPGPIILVAAAAVVALVPWRWAPAVGLAATVFLVVGLVVSWPGSGTGGRLADPSAFVPFAGTVLFLAGLVVALVAGVAAVAGRDDR